MDKISTNYIDSKENELIELATKIWEHPEVGFHEVKACEWTAEFLKKEGFDVEVGSFGVPTSIRATFGSGKPVIGLLGEYDALPGMSQKVSTKKEAVEDGAPGQACQHNLLGVGHVGAAIGLKKEMEENGLKGTIVFYGCPAEETLTGKGFMARGGAFKDLDVSFSWHPGTSNIVMRGTMTAMNTFKLHFKGITAHAGGDPHNGRSALDAVELTNVGINYLREHVTDDVRMHYSITNGGQAPNIVPDKASAWYFVRALSREAVVDTYERMIKVAKGAAMMTETEVEVEYLGGCYNTLSNNVLGDLIFDAMNELPVQNWSKEDIEFAKILEETKTNKSGVFESGEVGEQYLYSEKPLNIYSDSFGSTDVGDVQHLVPGIMFMTATANIGAAGHSWNNTACAGNSIGMKGMIFAAKSMAKAGLKILEDPSLVDKAKSEFEKSMNGKTYICPITDDIKLPE
ncbi:amidohydrolase [Miniphocaeibacter massiliensis]|uniref:amidohydrolase n=1 Tax=Miniphocaeibacter massiliensis TaxID=2041841 RepID=UPI001A919BD7|nr:amidohydrolase [Miniphocaeibacter massiliensis]